MKIEYLHKIFRITEIERKNMKVELSFGGDREWGSKLY